MQHFIIIIFFIASACIAFSQEPPPKKEVSEACGDIRSTVKAPQKASSSILKALLKKFPDKKQTLFDEIKQKFKNKEKFYWTMVPPLLSEDDDTEDWVTFFLNKLDEIPLTDIPSTENLNHWFTIQAMLKYFLQERKLDRSQIQRLQTYFFKQVSRFHQNIPYPSDGSENTYLSPLVFLEFNLQLKDPKTIEWVKEWLTAYVKIQKRPQPKPEGYVGRATALLKDFVQTNKKTNQRANMQRMVTAFEYLMRDPKYNTSENKELLTQVRYVLPATLSK